MTDQYEDLYATLLSQLEETESWESVQNALNKSLPNDSEETDYEAWLEGSKKFAEDNKALFMAMMK